MRGVLMKVKQSMTRAKMLATVLVVTYCMGWLFVDAMVWKTLSKRAVMVRFFDGTIKKATMPVSS
jgi:hypothetical protein